MQACDFDFDGFGGLWKLFLKWNGTRYATMEKAAEGGPIYQHAVCVEPTAAFLSGAKPPDAVQTQFDVTVNDLRLSPWSKAVDAGVALPNINDQYRGDAPDLGTYEQGSTLPHYGPR